MPDRQTLTTLQAARRIAEAVSRADLEHPAQSRPEVRSFEHAPTQAVLATLRELGLWFCRPEQE